MEQINDIMECIELVPLKIIFPSKEIDLNKWSVVASDQYTSQKEYWEEEKICRK